ncbi:MAG: right-handed parallel beta-helix repeat-containing protein [Bacteroidetes bacterium]|nr:right-handed parallel beta-helix repeat-containing protein [Bacteroidota bacterium]
MTTAKKFILYGMILFLTILRLNGQDVTPQEIQRQIQGQILAAKPGDTVQIPAGNLRLVRSIYIENQSRITLMGQGKDQTILSFAHQEEGMEALRVFNSRDIRLEGFSIEDPNGDAIIVQNVQGIMLKDIRAGWTKNLTNPEHSHGVFIDKSNRILIDSCEAYAAINAGVYIRQSRDLIIQGSFFHQNSVGISIINSSNSEIHHNISKYNAIGMAIYNLPGLLVYGEGSKIYKNEISENNIRLLSPSTYFNHSFPAGTGIAVMSFEKVAIFKNEIVNNKTLGVHISDFSFLKSPISLPEKILENKIIYKSVAAYQAEQDTSFNPFFHEINIFDNTFYREEQKPFTNHFLSRLLSDYYKKNPPSIVLTQNLANQTKQDVSSLCLVDNRNMSFVEINHKEALDNPPTDITKYNCKLPPLDPVSLYKN